jgi:hypothetical protein|nr:MAG TPA: resolvase [Caudoviricetes sp.]
MVQNNRPYVLWRRVSTKEQGESKLGLEAQVAIAEDEMGCPAVKIFTDVYSGTKLAGCQQLWQAIRYCKKNNLLLVVANTDRFRDVKYALTVLDEVGEGNIVFCDLPTSDRQVLTIYISIWEKQARQGRIKTQVALNELKKKSDRGEKWISKNGNLCDRLGRPADGIDENGKPYWDVSAMVTAASAARSDAAILWMEHSKAVERARAKRAEGWRIDDIVRDLGELYDQNIPDDPKDKNPYGTPTGCKPSKGTVSKWCREMNPLAV